MKSEMSFDNICAAPVRHQKMEALSLPFLWNLNPAPLRCALPGACSIFKRMTDFYVI